MLCIGIIWNRAISHEKEITSLILQMGNILHEKKIDLDSRFDDFVSGIYFDANPTHVQTKIQALKCDYSRTIKLMHLNIKTDYKYFSLKKEAFVYKNIEALKEKIRYEISLKIPNYYFDVIFHLTDNKYEYEKTLQFLENFFEKNIS
ncbi:MAG: hypothetical protein IJN54_16185 [Lachnospiraceae bacterium]|nr:hypothetical protein [Lachnospiraceae bacterium]